MKKAVLITTLTAALTFSSLAYFSVSAEESNQEITNSEDLQMLDEQNYIDSEITNEDLETSPEEEDNDMTDGETTQIQE